MNVVDLDGNSHKWHLIGHIAKGNNVNKSNLHIKARELIHTCYPTLQVLEEVSIYVRKSEVLYLDFYLPLIKTCVEVHGEQHFKFIQFYHNNKLGFIKHKKRDQDKKEWCRINSINMIELNFDETTDQWTQKIKNQYENS
jgi:hypothetical protein